MATGSDTRLVLHDLETHAVNFVKCEDIAQLTGLPNGIEGPGAHLKCVELGVKTEYYVRESFEDLCEYIAAKAPEIYARMLVTPVER